MLRETQIEAIHSYIIRGYSDRLVADLMGLATGVVAQVRNGTYVAYHAKVVEDRKSYRKILPHQSLQKRQAQQEPIVSTRPAYIDPLKLVRCKGCGGLVNLPCVLCTVRKSKNSLAESLI